MKISFLGTNGWYSTKTGNTICTLVESEKYYIIFDAGDGMSKLDQYIKKDKEIFLFLSHLHLDHIVGFHSLCKLKQKKPFNIFAPKKIKQNLEKIMVHPYAMSFKEFNFKINSFDIKKDINKIPFPVKFLELFHIDPSYGYRIELEGKKIVYCADTGVCENSIKLSKETDVLIHECSNGPGNSSGDWGHSNPEEVAGVAKVAKVKKLFMTHFAASEFLTLKERKVGEKIARKIFKNTICAKDDMTVEV